MTSIYEQLMLAGVDLDHHESDLYAEVTPESRRIVEAYQYRSNVTTYYTNGEQWYDIPFAFDPWWESHLGARLVAQEDGCFSVTYRGQVVMKDESFAVADQLCMALNGQGGVVGEINEVARNIQSATGSGS